MNVRLKSGYTLVELMVATTLTVLILGGVAASFVSAMRMMGLAMAETEFALASRELRDKLLFHAAPDGNNFHSAGLWSLANSASAIEGDIKINVNGTIVANSLAYETTQQAQLLFGDYKDGWGIYNDSDRRNLRWLRPGGIPLAADFADSVHVSEYGTDKNGRRYPRRYHIDINYRYHPAYLPESVKTFDFTRTESIVVPQMGKIHRRAFVYGETEAHL